MATLTKADLKRAFYNGFIYGLGSPNDKPLPTVKEIDELFADWYTPKKDAPRRNPNAEIEEWIRGESSQPPLLPDDWIAARQKP
jgi:hypothetical protein